MPTFYITTAIPYVNAAPHVGFAMELVLADVVARYHRLRGHDVRFLTGSDENSLKNVQAAEAEGLPVEDLVERNARAFQELRVPLDLSFDDFIRTSAESRHRKGVEKLWRACLANGDIYKKAYRGLYCVGCEQFYADADVVDGGCPEHGGKLEVVEEENYFFRLSRYADAIRAHIYDGRLRIVPDRYSYEIEAFLEGGLQDFSISRSQARARGWGIPVPDDLDQVMYVWFDALGNYISALDYGNGGEKYQRYWDNSDERVHVIGKGITRFHAVYWPAILLSAGLPLPTTISVHGYLTVEGQKIGKSLGNAIDPSAIVDQFGTDVVRYFLCRHIRTGNDGDFTTERVATARDAELADQLGNLLNRTVSMITQYYGGLVPTPSSEHESRDLVELAERTRVRYREAFAALRVDDALLAVWDLIQWANKAVVDRAPWKLAKKREESPSVEASLATILFELVQVLRWVATYLVPFLPQTAVRIRAQLGIPDLQWTDNPVHRVKLGEQLFPKST
jgi:methionyl-tRNA synthetase